MRAVAGRGKKSNTKLGQWFSPYSELEEIKEDTKSSISTHKKKKLKTNEDILSEQSDTEENKTKNRKRRKPIDKSNNTETNKRTNKRINKRTDKGTPKRATQTSNRKNQPTNSKKSEDKKHIQKERPRKQIRSQAHKPKRRMDHHKEYQKNRENRENQENQEPQFDQDQNTRRRSYKRMQGRKQLRRDDTTGSFQYDTEETDESDDEKKRESQTYSSEDNVISAGFGYLGLKKELEKAYTTFASSTYAHYLGQFISVDDALQTTSRFSLSTISAPNSSQNSFSFFPLVPNSVSGSAFTPIPASVFASVSASVSTSDLDSDYLSIFHTTSLDTPDTPQTQFTSISTLVSPLNTTIKGKSNGCNYSQGLKPQGFKPQELKPLCCLSLQIKSVTDDYENPICGRCGYCVICSSKISCLSKSSDDPCGATMSHSSNKDKSNLSEKENDRLYIYCKKKDDEQIKKEQKEQEPVLEIAEPKCYCTQYLKIKPFLKIKRQWNECGVAEVTANFKQLQKSYARNPLTLQNIMKTHNVVECLEYHNLRPSHSKPITEFHPACLMQQTSSSMTHSASFARIFWRYIVSASCAFPMPQPNDLGRSLTVGNHFFLAADELEIGIMGFTASEYGPSVLSSNDPNRCSNSSPLYGSSSNSNSNSTLMSDVNQSHQSYNQSHNQNHHQRHDIKSSSNQSHHVGRSTMKSTNHNNSLLFLYSVGNIQQLYMSLNEPHNETVLGVKYYSSDKYSTDTKNTTQCNTAGTVSTDTVGAVDKVDATSKQSKQSRQSKQYKKSDQGTALQNPHTMRDANIGENRQSYYLNNSSVMKTNIDSSDHNGFVEKRKNEKENNKQSRKEKIDDFMANLYGCTTPTMLCAAKEASNTPHNGLYAPQANPLQNRLLFSGSKIKQKKKYRERKNNKTDELANLRQELYGQIVSQIGWAEAAYESKKNWTHGVAPFKQTSMLSALSTPTNPISAFIDKNGVRRSALNSFITAIAWNKVDQALYVIFGYSILRLGIDVGCDRTPSSASDSIKSNTQRHIGIGRALSIYEIGSASEVGHKDGRHKECRFWGPTALACHPLTGEVFVADSEQKRIKWINSTGVYTLAVQCSDQTHGMVIDHKGNLYFSNAFENTIVCIKAQQLHQLCQHAANVSNYKKEKILQIQEQKKIKKEKQAAKEVNESKQSKEQKEAKKKENKKQQGVKEEEQKEKEIKEIKEIKEEKEDAKKEKQINEEENNDIKHLGALINVNTFDTNLSTEKDTIKDKTHKNKYGISCAHKIIDQLRKKQGQYPIKKNNNNNNNKNKINTNKKETKKILFPRSAFIVYGAKNQSGCSDNCLNLATFNFPMGLAVDLNDFVYVADRQNNCVRKISPGDGIVSTQFDVYDEKNQPSNTCLSTPRSKDKSPSIKNINKAVCDKTTSLCVDESYHIYTFNGHALKRIVPASQSIRWLAALAPTYLAAHSLVACTIVAEYLSVIPLSWNETPAELMSLALTKCMT